MLAKPGKRSAEPLEVISQIAQQPEVNQLLVSGLRKTFSAMNGTKVQVLRGVSFNAVGGETVAITGASGAGKSTLMHLLGGLEAADDGEISLNGTSLVSARPSVLAHQRNSQIGFIFQFHHLLPDLSATENTALPLMIGGLGHKEALVRATGVLSELGLGDRTDHPIGYLSGGEQQRVAIARAMIREPVMLLADEPTGNLDAAIEDEISEQLVAYARKRAGIVIIATHNQRLVRLCDRSFVLKEGQLHPA